MARWRATEKSIGSAETEMVETGKAASTLRLETFRDAVFAIAITLLAVDLALPASSDDLGGRSLLMARARLGRAASPLALLVGDAELVSRPGWGIESEVSPVGEGGVACGEGWVIDEQPEHRLELVLLAHARRVPFADGLAKTAQQCIVRSLLSVGHFALDVTGHRWKRTDCRFANVAKSERGAPG